jgi:PEP-CTERM motif
MKTENWLAGAVAVGALAFGVQSAHANAICMGCEVIDGVDGTYVGAYSPVTFDEGTFNHTAIQSDVGASTAFEDFLAFDLNPGGNGSISADFTEMSAIIDFAGELWSDGGSTCDATGTNTEDRWEIIASGLSGGRYIIRITGNTRASGGSTYSGQLSFGTESVPEPGTLALLSFGLLGLRVVRRRAA